MTPDHPVGDAAVIAASRADPERFAEIYDAYFVAVHGYVERRLGRDVADDLTAETFLIAFRQRESYDLARDSARPWLYGIATNLVGRHRRTELSRYRALARTGAAPDVESPEERVAEQLVAGQVRTEIVRALGRLAKGDRDVVLLMAVADLSREEIATALSIPYGTVGSRLHRARRKLRQALPDVGHTAEWGLGHREQESWHG